LWGHVFVLCSSHPGYGPIVGACERGNTSLGFIKGVEAVSFSRGTLLQGASYDLVIRQSTLNLGSIFRYRNFRTFTSPRPVQFACVALDSSGEFIAAGGHDVFEIYLWSVKMGRLLEVETCLLMYVCGNACLECNCQVWCRTGFIISPCSSQHVKKLCRTEILVIHLCNTVIKAHVLGTVVYRNVVVKCGRTVLHFLTMSRVIHPVHVDVFSHNSNFTLLLYTLDIALHRVLSTSTFIGILSTSCSNMKLVPSHGFLLKLPFEKVLSVNQDHAMEDFWGV